MQQIEQGSADSSMLFDLSSLLLANNSSLYLPAATLLSPKHSFSGDAGRKLNSPLMKGNFKTVDTTIVDLYEEIAHDAQDQLEFEREREREENEKAGPKNAPYISQHLGPSSQLSKRNKVISLHSSLLLYRFCSLFLAF
jgi:hypothetical protein